MTGAPIELYADGACTGNPGPGGWAALLRRGRHERLLSGGESRTTNNRMELTACIEGLLAIRKPSTVIVATDSQYVVRGMREWLPRWLARGWRTHAGDPVQNRDLWERLLAAAEPHRIEWHWVRGHAGHPENARVDAAARAAIPRVAGEGDGR
jgi:ribonuclease HI